MIASRNSTTPFTYNFNFTNNTAELLLTLKAPVADVVLNFSGKRQDPDGGDSDADRAPSLGGDYFSIGLEDPALYHLPRFSYANGTGFKWHDGAHGWWATATASYVSAWEWLHLISYVAGVVWITAR